MKLITLCCFFLMRCWSNRIEPKQRKLVFYSYLKKSRINVNKSLNNQLNENFFRVFLSVSIIINCHTVSRFDIFLEVLLHKSKEEERNLFKSIKLDLLCVQCLWKQRILNLIRLWNVFISFKSSDVTFLFCFNAPCWCSWSKIFSTYRQLWVKFIKPIPNIPNH